MIANVLLMILLSAPLSTETIYSFDLAVLDDGYSLTNGKGKHWQWLKWGWGTSNKGPLELQFSTKGGGGAAAGTIVKNENLGPVDIGILRIDAGKARLRCLAEECRVKATRGDDTTATLLAHDQTVDVKVPAAMEIVCKR